MTARHARSFCVVLPTLLLLAPLAPAQGVSATIRSETALRVQAKSVLKTLPPASDLSQGIVLAAYADSENNAKLTTTFQHSPITGTRFTLNESGIGQGFMQPDVRVGQHSTRLTLQAPRPVTGTVRVRMTWHDTLFSHRASGSGEVQVGSQVFRIWPPLLKQIDQSVPVTFGPGGLTIRTTTEQRGSISILPGSFIFDLSIEFTPKIPCGVVAYGKTCGATMSGLAAPTNDLVLEMKDGFVNAPGLLVLGLERQSFTIPRTPCVLHTKIAFLGGFQTGADGGAKLLIVLPSGVVLRFQAQAAVFASSGGQLLLEMTNGVEFSCGG